jgi:starch-binding outer membrane protein, SusD/RagB family
MKKILMILSIFCFGCSDLLDETPKGQVLGDFALSNVDGLEAALTGAYKPWSNTFSSGFNTAATNAVVMGSDDLTTHKASNKSEFREFDQFNVSALNSRGGTIWNGCYKAIQGANNVIANYKQLLGGANEATVKQIAGEAFFVRAYSYYWLVRLWGRIPKLVEPVVTAEILKMGVSEPAEVYELIVADLLEAESLMADIKRAPGRASSGSAKALLADVYLTMAGWPVNDPSNYAKAAAKAKEVIDDKEKYGFDLVQDLNELWNGVPSSGSPNGTSEEVFAIHHCGSCQWFTSNATYGSACMAGAEENGWDDYFAEIKFFNEFPAGVRKDVTFKTDFVGGTISWQNTATKHPYYKKFRLADDVNTWQTSMQLPLIRYAHVLLVYAEAQAHSSGADASAYQAVNAIRARAGLPDLANLSNAEFINSVIQERAWEFAGEYTRWFDLVRLDQVAQANSNKDVEELQIQGEITSDDYWLPIPAGDLNLNPNLGG